MTKPIVTDISKELEELSFKHLKRQNPEFKTIRNETTKPAKFNRWFMIKKVSPNRNKESGEPKTQIVAFQRSMKLLFISGQCLGLNSIAGVLETDVTKMRFSMFSWRFLLCMTIGVMQTIAMALILYRLTKKYVSVNSLGHFAFYLTSCITTFVFLNSGRKWPFLMKELSDLTLNEYIDPTIKYKCYTSYIVMMILGIVEHILNMLSNFSKINDCRNVSWYDAYLRKNFFWYYELELPRNTAIDVSIQILNVISTMTWNYSDLYVICLSTYLASILKKINNKIISASKEPYLPSAYWKSLREDYNKATRLVRSFDDVINCIVFISFANNLFFICLQLYNILGHGFNKTQSRCSFHEFGLFSGNEQTIYIIFSSVYQISRCLAVSMSAASVHSASVVPRFALYNVPSTSYCNEVERFIQQVHTDTVALSGLQFYYVTRELVLSVAATVITYELVLLQVSGDEIMVKEKST